MMALMGMERESWGLGWELGMGNGGGELEMGIWGVGIEDGN